MVDETWRSDITDDLSRKIMSVDNLLANITASLRPREQLVDAPLGPLHAQAQAQKERLGPVQAQKARPGAARQSRFQPPPLGPVQAQAQAQQASLSPRQARAVMSTPRINMELDNDACRVGPKKP